MEINLTVRLPRKSTRLIFHLIVTGCCVVYLLTWKVFLKQYVGSTMTVMLIEHYFLCSHNGTHEDINVQIIDHCEPKDQEARKDFWVFHLDTLHSKGLDQKRVLKH